MVAQKDYYGDTVADVIAKACRELGEAQEHLEIEILETGSAGIFGLCRKKAHIRVSKKANRQTLPVAEAELQLEAEVKPEALESLPSQNPAPSKRKGPQKAANKGVPKGKMPLPQEEAPPRPPEEELLLAPPSQDILNALEADITQLLNLMGFPSQVRVSLERNTVLCHISDTHQAALVGQDGKVLDSLQYLLRKMSSRLLPAHIKLSLEVGDYRERRLEFLKQQVLELAAKVREDGMTQAIPSLNPSERRLVHMVLQEDKELRSRSVGEGLFKKVLIYKPGRKKYVRKGKKGPQDDEPSEN
jgi:spoIIIJ-associated protein